MYIFSLGCSLLPWMFYVDMGPCFTFFSEFVFYPHWILIHLLTICSMLSFYVSLGLDFFVCDFCVPWLSQNLPCVSAYRIPQLSLICLPTQLCSLLVIKLPCINTPWFPQSGSDPLLLPPVCFVGWDKIRVLIMHPQLSFPVFGSSSTVIYETRPKP